MLQNIRRAIAVFLAGMMLCMLTACGGQKKNEAASQLAMTVNGHEVPVGTYAANYLYNKATVESLMYQYGVTWDSEYGEAYKEQLSEMAHNQTVALYLIPDQFEAAGLTLTAEDEEEIIDEDAALEELGFTHELIAQVSRYTVMLNKLNEYYFGENGVMAPEESEVEAYFQENYMQAKHVLISTMDESGQAITDEAELAALEQKAQEVYQRAIAGEDFDSLVQEFGEDPGMEANPDGYQFTDGVMIAEFQNATEALGINEISEPVQSSYGWHIIQRLPLREENRASVYGDIVLALTGMDINSLVDQWINEAEVVTEPVESEINFDNVEDYKYTV